ncbi:MAG TPA: PspC domain-containing protein [Patescibacteria group bacterium]|nr:PspC domain-containing protein [Patescibacteria group bacterium]
MADKKLYRSNEDKIIAGVCGGLGVYFDVDPLLIRLIFILSGLFGGTGILIYVLFWILVPKEKEESILNKDKVKDLGNDLKQGAKELKDNFNQAEKKKRRRLFIAWFLIVLGIIYIANQLALPNVVKIIFGWPIILIFIGLFLLIRNKK